MKSALFAGVAAALLTAALPVIAATPPPQPERVVTFADVKAAADKLWDRMDVNHDGKVDAADHDARLLERFDAWDTNHDGMISKDEFLATVHAREAKAHGPRQGDADGPGAWRMGGRDHDGREGDHQRGPHRGGMAVMAIVAPALHEARKDGVMTRAAFDGAVKARFDALDTDHNGTLTREELHAAWHGGWGHRERGDGAPHDGANPPPPAQGH